MVTGKIVEVSPVVDCFIVIFQSSTSAKTALRARLRNPLRQISSCSPKSPASSAPATPAASGFTGSLVRKSCRTVLENSSGDWNLQLRRTPELNLNLPCSLHRHRRRRVASHHWLGFFSQNAEKLPPKLPETPAKPLISTLLLTPPEMVTKKKTPCRCNHLTGILCTWNDLFSAQKFSLFTGKKKKPPVTSSFLTPSTTLK
ncbi:hypothetical protein U1Q18_043754 [Sarracenia purpurea var. burkii]